MESLKNREVFLRDPVSTSIPNDGVARVIKPQSEAQWDVLRYELQTFVCEGEYQRGMERVLSAFIDNLQRPQQQAVWVSGFFGSGKSHFVRVLESLWRDIEFPDGVRARSLVTLPTDIQALLTELSRVGRQEGGLWSAAGTLGAGSGSVRLGLLATLFRNAGLPEQYPAARLALWLKQNGWFDTVKAHIAERGRELDTEFRNMYVSPILADALISVVPDLASSVTEIHALLRTQYPRTEDISDDELRATAKEILTLESVTLGKLPLTLLVFDELQQFIADDPMRTLQVQDIVEMCTAQFESRVLFVATGQSALQARTELSKLQGRFSIPVTLSDADVEKVVREVVLRKAPDKVSSVRIILDAASGEIDRHLAGTKVSSRLEDIQDRVADYPLLPVRRRLWESMLRAIDSAGTAGQLRTQLRLVHDSTREVANKPLGTVVPADAMYWQLESNMLQSGVLLREVATIIQQMNDGTSTGKLRSRLCALIFLINKLPLEGPAATGVRATADALADLLVEDLTSGSAALRQQVPEALQNLVDNGTLMLLADEYRLQTRESSEWETDYRSRYSRILADNPRIAGDRALAIKNAVSASLRGLTFSQGASKTPRKFDLHFGADVPPQNTGNVPIWLRDEWSATGRTVREEAQIAGVESPVVFVHLPKVEANALDVSIARFAAAEETIKTRATPQTPAGIEARDAMESRIQMEGLRVSAFIEEIVKRARVYQGGGSEVNGDSFPTLISQSVEAALVRLFQQFTMADQAGWEKVVTRASQGAADALSQLGYSGEADKHTACQEVRKYIGGAGKKGSDVRRYFMAAPYGWPQDAIDGCLMVLLSGGFLRATHNGQPIQAKGMTRQQIGVSDFFSEGVTISALQRIDVRNMASNMGLAVKSGEEMDAIPRILERLIELAEAAGGEPPRPERPDTTQIKEFQQLSGNQQFVGVHEKRDQLLEFHKAWSSRAKLSEERVPEWRRLESLLKYAQQSPVTSELETQVEAIRTGRSLLDNPDPQTPILRELSTALRAAVNDAHDQKQSSRDREIKALESWEEWSRLGENDQQRILSKYDLQPISPIDLGTDEALLNSLEATSLQEWDTQIVALPVRAAKAREEAARFLEPKTVSVKPQPATLKNEGDVKAYIQEFQEELLTHINAGNPVVIL